MRELLEYLIKSIVKNEDDIKVDEVKENGRTILKVKANPSDIGLIIGKGGRIIRSLKNLVKVKAIKEGVMVDIEIVDAEEEKKARPNNASPKE